MPTLTVHDTAAIRRIEEAIGYTFNDKRLLLQVLTRKTYLKIDPEAPDNEVLEFYGDTLMNYHVTNYFMSKFAHMLEDGLFFMRTVEQFTDMRSHYVCNRYLTERVKALGLARYLRAQNRDAELRRDGEKAYADIFESLVGAIYLDSYQNDTLIRAFILRQLGIEPKRLPDEIEAFDYDTLQTAFGGDETALPAPEETASLPTSDVSPADAHAEIPAPEVEAHEETVAEPDAPDAPVAAPDPVEESPIPAEIPHDASAVSLPATNCEKLAALCESLGYELPTYGEPPKNAPNARPVAACTLKYKDTKGKLVKISLNDSGKTLAEATEKAAAKMLAKVAKQAADAETRQARRETPAPIPSPALAEVEVMETPAPIEAEAAVAAEVTPAIEAVTESVITEETATAAEEQPNFETAPAGEHASAVEAEPTTTAETAAEAETVAETEAPAKAEPVAETEAPAEVEAVVPAEDKPTVKKPRSKSSARSKKSDKETEATDGAESAPAKEKKPSTRRASKKTAPVAEETPAVPVEAEPVVSVEAPAAEAVIPAEPAEAPAANKPAAEAKPAKARKPRASAKSKKAASPSEEA